jgi:hypothetical protein
LRRSLTTGVVGESAELDCAWSAGIEFIVLLFRVGPAGTIAVGVRSRMIRRGCVPISRWRSVISNESFQTKSPGGLRKHRRRRCCVAFLP